jgi:hypothetical protein
MQKLLASLEDPESSMPSKNPRPVTTEQNIYELAARFSYLALLTDALSSDEAFLMRLRLAATLRNPQGIYVSLYAVATTVHLMLMLSHQTRFVVS